MPLTPPVDRTRLHTRRIEIAGYRRGDGLYDIEASLSDTKTYALPTEDRGVIAPGEKLHGMWLRLTVDDRMMIHAAEAATDFAPYAVCPQAAPNFARLEGLRIGRGFLKQAAERVGGTAGCTHLRELLQQIGTTAYQTIGPARAQHRMPTGQTVSAEELDRRTSEEFGGPKALLNTCLAYAEDGPVVRRRWPELAAGPQ